MNRYDANPIVPLHSFEPKTWRNHFVVVDLWKTEETQNSHTQLMSCSLPCSLLASAVFVPLELHWCLGKEGACNCTGLQVFVSFESLIPDQNGLVTHDFPLISPRNMHYLIHHSLHNATIPALNSMMKNLINAAASALQVGYNSNHYFTQPNSLSFQVYFDYLYI